MKGWTDQLKTWCTRTVLNINMLSLNNIYSQIKKLFPLNFNHSWWWRMTPSQTLMDEPKPMTSMTYLQLRLTWTMVSSVILPDIWCQWMSMSVCRTTQLYARSHTTMVVRRNSRVGGWETAAPVIREIYRRGWYKLIPEWSYNSNKNHNKTHQLAVVIKQ